MQAHVSNPWAERRTRTPPQRTRRQAHSAAQPGRARPPTGAGLLQHLQRFLPRHVVRGAAGRRRNALRRRRSSKGEHAVGGGCRVQSGVGAGRGQTAGTSRAWRAPVARLGCWRHRRGAPQSCHQASALPPGLPLPSCPPRTRVAQLQAPQHHLEFLGGQALGLQAGSGRHRTCVREQGKHHLNLLRARPLRARQHHTEHRSASCHMAGARRAHLAAAVLRQPLFVLAVQVVLDKRWVIVAHPACRQ